MADQWRLQVDFVCAGHLEGNGYRTSREKPLVHDGERRPYFKGKLDRT
jgi:hypothetical protein